MTMTPKEALEHMLNEFVGTFGCGAESCCDPSETHEAIRVLCKTVGMEPIDCPGNSCKDRGATREARNP
jgi:hypothetical protein